MLFQIQDLNPFRVGPPSPDHTLDPSGYPFSRSHSAPHLSCPARRNGICGEGISLGAKYCCQNIAPTSQVKTRETIYKMPVDVKNKTKDQVLEMLANAINAKKDQLKFISDESNEIENIVAVYISISFRENIAFENGPDMEEGDWLYMWEEFPRGGRIVTEGAVLEFIVKM